MNCGFQANAFQNDAFQVCVTVPSGGVDSFAGNDDLDERMWRRLPPIEEEKPQDDLTIVLAGYLEYYN